MLLLSLNLENFRQHRQTELVFPKGLVGILGANGTGKSTILEAIAWAIYGNQSKIVRGGSKTIIWQLAEPSASAVAELEFAFGGDTYTIKRGQSASKSTAEFRKGNRVIANSVKAVEEKVRELLKMSHQEFFNSYFTGQKDLQFLGTISEGRDRENFISKMLGYEAVRLAQGDPNTKDTIRYDRKLLEQEQSRIKGAIEQIDPELVNQQLRVVKQHLIINQQEQNQVTEQITSKYQELTTTQQELQLLEIKQKEYQRLSTEIAIQKTNYQQAVQRIANLATEVNNLEQQVNLYEQLKLETANLDDLRQQAEQLRQAELVMQEKQRLQQKLTNLHQEINQLTERIANLALQLQILPEVQASLTSQAAELAQLETKQQELQQIWQTAKLTCETHIKTHQSNYQKIKQQMDTIATAGKEGNCPTCDRPLHEEFELVMAKFTQNLQQESSMLDTLQQELVSLSNPPRELTEVQQRLPNLKNNIKRLAEQEKQLAIQQNEHLYLQQQLRTKQSEADDLATQLASFSYEYDRNLHQQIKQQIANLQPKYEQCLRLSNTPELLLQKRQQLADLRMQLSDLEQTISNLETSQQGLNFQETIYQQTRQAVDNLNQALNQLHLQQQNLIHQQQTLTRDQQSYELQLQQYQQKQTELAKIQYQYNLLNTLDKSFTDLQKYLNQQIRPQLAELASSFLNELTDGRYTGLELDENYSIQVIENGDRKSVISGGEEDIVNLCLRLAISEMIATSRGHEFSLLILDEVFGSLDDQRRANVMQLLNRLNDRFEQVLVISHVGMIKDTLNYTITLEYDPQQQCTRIKSTDDNLGEL
ncbi:MAG: AAA family ATPase [Pseudanabaenaceae cyanobacterium]